MEASAREACKEPDAKTKENEIVELRPIFATETSALHFMCSFGNCL